MRVRLFTRSEHDHVLLMVVHHIVIDFWSLAIVLDELSALYPAHLAGVPATLPKPSAQYTATFAGRRKCSTDRKAKHSGSTGASSWRDHYPSLSLPIDRPRPPLQTYRGAAHEFNLDAELTDHLRVPGEDPRGHLVHGLAGCIPDDP